MNRGAMPPLSKFVATSLFAALLVACDGGAGAPEIAAEPPLAGASIGGPFELTGSDGRTVRWSDFEGKYRIVYFGYAYCPDICPTDVQRMMHGYRIFSETSPDLAAQIVPIFITIDPERDTPEVVGEFASAFSDELIGLTGTTEQVKQAADNFRIFFAKGEEQPGGGYLMDHSNVVYLFGPQGEPLATLPVDLGPEAVAQELEKWVR